MISKNLKNIQQTIPDDVVLVAVSKTKPNQDILEAYESGQRIFGENKIQEMVAKYDSLPKDIEWHMIGHLQRNKVKYMAEFVSLIHGVDSLKLLNEINKQAKKHDRDIHCLLQIKIAEEDSKFGMSALEAKALLNSDDLNSLQNICITGLMGMATFTEDTNQVRSEFEFLKQTYDGLKDIATDNVILEHISMGMSGDYDLAISCGSTMIRVGSSIFGARQYSI